MKIRKPESYILIIFCFIGLHVVHAQQIAKEELIYLTDTWKGERFDDGRPKIPADLIERAKGISIDVAWQILDNEGYASQYEGEWKSINDQPVVGRAVTAMFLPSRPDIEKQIKTRGHEQGFKGNTNSWPIAKLTEGDIYVADAFGKTLQGTLIGDNLGNAIYSKTKRGVVFYGSSRDLEGLSKIEGFNAFVKNWNPTYLKNVMLAGLNTPIKMDGELEAHLIAIACSQAPKGYDKWTLSLLTKTLKEKGYVAEISQETVRRTLKKTKLNLGKSNTM